jgi:hypothetical protein
MMSILTSPVILMLSFIMNYSCLESV